MVEFWEVYYFTMSVMGLMMLGLMVAVVGFTVVHGFKIRKKSDNDEK